MKTTCSQSMKRVGRDVPIAPSECAAHARPMHRRDGDIAPYPTSRGSWRADSPSLGAPGAAAFTMIEIALSLAIIAFGMVAILGVLPSGMTVQRDNRWSAIINEDGQFWMNAIRNGLSDGSELTNNVVSFQSYTDPKAPGAPFHPTSNYEIVGQLSQPFQINRAHVRAISSPATDQKVGSDLEYVLFAMMTNCPSTIDTSGPMNLWDIRLVFRWPLYANGEVGNSKKTFRTLVQGSLEFTNNLYFFRNQLLIP